MSSSDELGDVPFTVRSPSTDAVDVRGIGRRGKGVERGGEGVRLLACARERASRSLEHVPSSRRVAHVSIAPNVKLCTHVADE